MGNVVLQAVLLAAAVATTAVTYYFAYVKKPTGLMGREVERRNSARTFIYYIAGLALVQCARLALAIQGS